MTAEIKAKYSLRRAAVMYGLELDWSEGTYNVLQKKEKLHKLLEPVWSRFSGTEMEENFFFFEDPVDALLACLEARKTVKQMNEGKPPEAQVHVKGFGLHFSEVLVIPGTDVHWGDAVNTASKLGEDLAGFFPLTLAAECVIYATPTIRDLVSESPRVGHLQWTEQKLEASGVDLTAWAVAEV